MPRRNGRGASSSPNCVARDSDVKAELHGLLGQVIDRALSLRGHLRGDAAAARYCGVNRKTFFRWQNDPDVKGRELIKPRIIKSQKFYRISNLDAFMHPDLNSETTEFHGTPYQSKP